METINRLNRGRIIGGLLLIFFGVIALIGTFVELGILMWAVVVAVGGALFFVLYLTKPSEPGLLIPAYVMWAVAGLLTLIGLNILNDEAIAYYILTAVALPFIVGWIRRPGEWGLLIPAYVLLSINGIIFMGTNDLFRAELIPTYIMAAIALPFLLGFVISPRKNAGLLIPAYVMLAIGTMIGLIVSGILVDLLIPAYVMYAIALPFLLVFLVRPRNWWALIPGGIMFLIGSGFLLSVDIGGFVVPGILIVAGIVLLARQFIGDDGESSSEAEFVTVKEVDAEPVIEDKPTSGPEADVAPAE